MNAAVANVLVVDDDVDTCLNLADILTEFDYRVETAHDGYAALELVRTRPFDVALLDLKLPGMDGLQLYREIKRLCPSVVAVIISADATGEASRAALDAGAWQVLAKPVHPSRLLPLIEQAVGQPLVLVVDDDPHLCDTLWDLFREQGYRVGIAHEADRATELLRDTAFRVVLIDMLLRQGDGGTVFRSVRAHNPASRVILITGHAAELGDIVHRVLAAGADAVCYKPFDVPRLLETVDRLAEKYPG